MRTAALMMTAVPLSFGSFGCCCIRSPKRPNRMKGARRPLTGIRFGGQRSYFQPSRLAVQQYQRFILSIGIRKIRLCGTRVFFFILDLVSRFLYNISLFFLLLLLLQFQRLFLVGLNGRLDTAANILQGNAGDIFIHSIASTATVIVQRTHAHV